MIKTVIAIIKTIGYFFMQEKEIENPQIKESMLTVSAVIIKK
jgi:hypothetical protein